MQQFHFEASASSTNLVIGLAMWAAVVLFATAGYFVQVVQAWDTTCSLDTSSQDACVLLVSQQAP